MVSNMIFQPKIDDDDDDGGDVVVFVGDVGCIGAERRDYTGSSVCGSVAPLFFWARVDFGYIIYTSTLSHFILSRSCHLISKNKQSTIRF